MTRYYAIRINAHEPHDTPESARKEAESLPMAEGDEWGILELVGVTRRAVTTTWLGKQDIAGACEQTATHTVNVALTAPGGELEEIGNIVRSGIGRVGPMISSTGWSWPILPPGHSYLNPEGLTVEQLGDGWRPLCTLDESFPRDHEWRAGKHWLPGIACAFAPRDADVDRTYRTRAPIPTQQ